MATINTQWIKHPIMIVAIETIMLIIIPFLLCFTLSVILDPVKVAVPLNLIVYLVLIRFFTNGLVFSFINNTFSKLFPQHFHYTIHKLFK